MNVGHRNDAHCGGTLEIDSCSYAANRERLYIGLLAKQNQCYQCRLASRIIYYHWSNRGAYTPLQLQASISHCLI